jgi:hypothetical protein
MVVGKWRASNMPRHRIRQTKISQSASLIDVQSRRRYAANGFEEQLAAVQIAASSHFNNAWTPRAGSAAFAIGIRNTCLHPDHILIVGTKGAIRIEGQHSYGLGNSSGSLAILLAICQFRDAVTYQGRATV